MWSIIIKSKLVKDKPVKVWFNNHPLVLFRGKSGGVSALLDRCPHRGAPLSQGAVNNGSISCPYHGWKFDGDVACKEIPGLACQSICKSFKVQSFLCKESQGMVWITDEKDLSDLPYRIPGFGERGFKTVNQEIEIEGTVENIAEIY
jgi:phenylpropionate dioxygenase-like ring-hydroxylating dioxygenase large terminal subunit